MKVNVPRVVFGVIILIGIIFIGCGWFIDAYSGIKLKYGDGTWEKIKFYKNELCTIDSNSAAISKTCKGYCDDTWKLYDIYDAMCNTNGFRKHTKNLNIAAFWIGLVGCALVFVSAFLTLSKALHIIFNSFAVIGSFLGFVASALYGIKNKKFRYDIGFTDKEYAENIYYAGYILLDIGTIITAICSCASICYSIMGFS